MKHSLKIKTSAAAALLSALLLLTACAGQGNVPEETTPGPRELETVDLTDERTITDLSDYESRFAAAFVGTAPVPETDVTWTENADGTVCITGYTGGESVVVIPDTLNGKTVTSVAEGAFRNAAFRALCLPDTVTEIGFGAMEKCGSLATLKTPVFTCPGKAWFGSLFGAASYEINRAGIPAALTTLILTGSADAVPEYCFQGCTDLEAVMLPGSVKSLGDFAFYGCDRLCCVSLPDGLETIGEYAFGNCLSLRALTVPASVTRMGRSMLEGCGALESLTIPFVGNAENGWLGFLFGAVDHTFSEGYIPASLIRVAVTTGTTLPANAFYECSRIREIVLPRTLTEVGHRAFYRCAYLSVITLPDSLTSLGDEAFSGCVRLTHIDLSHVTSLGVQTFRGCLSLTDVTPPACAIPDYTFEGTPYGQKN